jgi:hypothetical protein
MSDYKPATDKSLADVQRANDAFYGDHIRESRQEHGDTTEDAEIEPTVTTGKKIKTFGGWYRHDPVTHNGENIGHIQVRSRGGRIETTTHHTASGSAVLGSDPKWLAKFHTEHKAG